ncbi:hypothetical protein BST28156_06997 [Burkholderia stagnalis]|nr:hypothetical protein BST28156_06997 [Burkholderia stagnalis]
MRPDRRVGRLRGIDDPHVAVLARARQRHLLARVEQVRIERGIDGHVALKLQHALLDARQAPDLRAHRVEFALRVRALRIDGHHCRMLRHEAGQQLLAPLLQRLHARFEIDRLLPQREPVVARVDRAVRRTKRVEAALRPFELLLELRQLRVHEADQPIRGLRFALRVLREVRDADRVQDPAVAQRIGAVERRADHVGLLAALRDQHGFLQPFGRVVGRVAGQVEARAGRAREVAHEHVDRPVRRVGVQRLPDPALPERPRRAEQARALQRVRAVAAGRQHEALFLQALRHVEGRDVDAFRAGDVAARQRRRQRVGAVREPPAEQRQVARPRVDIELRAVDRARHHRARLQHLDFRRRVGLQVEHRRRVTGRRRGFRIGRALFDLKQDVGAVDGLRAQRIHGARDPAGEHRRGDHATAAGQHAPVAAIRMRRPHRGFVARIRRSGCSHTASFPCGATRRGDEIRNARFTAKWPWPSARPARPTESAG